MQKVRPHMTISNYISGQSKAYKYSEQTIVVSANRINVGNVIFETEIVNELPYTVKVTYNFEEVKFARSFSFEDEEEDKFYVFFDNLFVKFSKLVPCKKHFRSDLQNETIFPKDLRRGDILTNPVKSGCSTFGVVALVLDEVYVPSGCNQYCFCNLRNCFKRGYCKACVRFRANYNRSNTKDDEIRVFDVIREGALPKSEVKYLRGLSFSEVSRKICERYNEEDRFVIWLREQMILSLIHPNGRRFKDFPLTLRMSIDAEVHGIKSLTGGSFKNGKHDGTYILASHKTTTKTVESIEYQPGIQETPIVMSKYVIQTKKVSYFGFILSGDSMYPNEGVWPSAINGFRLLVGGIDYDQTGLFCIVEKYLLNLLLKVDYVGRKRINFFLKCLKKVKQKETNTFRICKKITQLFLNFQCKLDDGATYRFSLPSFFFFEDSTDYQDACAMIVGSLYYCLIEFQKLEIPFDVFGVLWDSESGVSKFFKKYSTKLIDQLQSEYGWFMELLMLSSNESISRKIVPLIRCVGHAKKGICGTLRNSCSGMSDSKKSLVIPIQEIKIDDELSDVTLGVVSYYPIVEMYSIETTHIQKPKITKLTYDSVYPTKDKTMSERLAGQILCKNTLAGLDFYFLSKFEYPNDVSVEEVEVEKDINVTKKEIMALQEFITMFKNLKNLMGADRKATEFDLKQVRKSKLKLMNWRYVLEEVKKQNVRIEIGLTKNYLRLDEVNRWIADCNIYEYLYLLFQKLGMDFYPDNVFNQKKLESLFGVLKTLEGFHQNPRSEEYPKRLSKGIIRLVNKLSRYCGNSEQDLSDLESKLLINSDLTELIKEAKQKWKSRLSDLVLRLRSEVFVYPKEDDEQQILKKLDNPEYYNYLCYRNGNVIKNVCRINHVTSETSKIVVSVLHDDVKKNSLGSELFTPQRWIVHEMAVWEEIFSANFRLVLYSDKLFIFEESISDAIIAKRTDAFCKSWDNSPAVKGEDLKFMSCGKTIFTKIVIQFCSQRFFEAIEITGMRCQKYVQSLRKNVK